MTFQRISILEFDGLDPSRFPTSAPAAAVSMDPVESSISSTFGVAEVVNSSVSSARTSGGIASRNAISRATPAEDFLVVIGILLLRATVTPGSIHRPHRHRPVVDHGLYRPLAGELRRGRTPARHFEVREPEVGAESGFQRHGARGARGHDVA